jgi:N6-L-threonylcarbamoyladenine synthase
MAVLGIDTSNYTTSAALYGFEKGLPRSCGRPLRVEKGERGLRQSDAVFSHTKNIPELFEDLFSGYVGGVEAIGVSYAPRETKGSYMPCFLTGVAAASALSCALKVPLYRFSHQAGHAAAAAFGSGNGDLLKKEFLAWHLSGGTSELLLVNPSEDSIITCRRLGGTSDASAGQIIDRAGVLLGLPFPCGKGIDALSADFSGEVRPAQLSVKGLEMSLSGLENKVCELISAGKPREEIARFLLESLYLSVKTVTSNALTEHPGLPLLCSGGVMSNSLIREKMTRDFNAVFAPPEYSADNAYGIAALAYVKFQKDYKRGE